MASSGSSSVVVEEKSLNVLEDSPPVNAVRTKDGELLSPDVRPTAERQLVRQLDIRLMPTIIVIFIMNYIDRSAVSSARLQGLTEDLHLTQIQYSTVLAVLCASYVPAQIPSNMILNRISRPSYYIPACVILWGLTSTMTGMTRNYTGIVLCRICIGIPEAAFYPGAMYLLSRWYTRKELAFRSAVIYGGLLISNAFGNLMAAGVLSGMQGRLGIAAWRWYATLYSNGSISMAIGILAIFILPDYPHNTRWLTPAQLRLAQVRLAEDAGEADEDAANESAFVGLKLALKDPKVAIFSIMNCSQLLGLGFINFFPTIADTLGFSTTVSLLLCAPPWIYATIVCAVNAWSADRTGERFFHHCWPWWGVIIAYIIGASTTSIGARYFGMFLMAAGYSGKLSRFALTAVWVSNAIPRPPAKRSAAIGIVNGIGNMGNLISSYTWQSQWGPDYHPSMYIGISTLTFSTILAFVIRCMLVHENKKLKREEVEDLKGARRERIEEAARLEGLTFKEALERRRRFRYLY
ncbi:MFS general substrate transporter [Laetiporus sulphureus 93-53]|uniref:MFS general substrate transporter n=1 Tax=Laetiporus sulphureus 93-53 TaxID=1314785 RepID=A0A165DR75_9APHY|nr:MFS general substrate transporter [Laetiporus sulphureus 93-53]KZT05457.1 MFS general substrate transporter [Laetiporus sulphureus 93-53]